MYTYKTIKIIDSQKKKHRREVVVEKSDINKRNLFNMQ